MGYHRAGFEVVGVDNEPQPHFPFEFVQADALEYLAEHGAEYDAIHASPPCQGYTPMANRYGSKVSRLIPVVREGLQAVSTLWVIENVYGATDLKPTLELTGQMFGLGVERPRLFEASVLLLSPSKGKRPKNAVAVYGSPERRWLWKRKDGSVLRCASLAEAEEAMGINWMTWHEIIEAIPPAYTEFIGRQLMEHLKQETLTL